MKKIFIITLAVFALVFTACKTDNLGDAVPYDKFYQDVSDADRAIIGIYAQFASLAEQVVVLNELRADLMDVTPSATPELESLNQSQFEADNEWISPSKFYAVINSCNDALASFDKMLAENKFTRDEYNERYSDIGALRCWIYLQLLNIYGSVPYITEPLVNLADVEKYSGQRENADEMLPKLIAFMLSLPTLSDYVYSELVANSTRENYNLDAMFVSKKMVLADLYLYNSQYAEAAHYYRQVMAVDEGSTNLNVVQFRYRLRTYAFTATSGEPTFYAALFRDGHIEDENGLINSWKNIFSDAPVSRKANNRSAFERIWHIPFDDKLEPVNPFAVLFENNYQLKASDYAIDSLWAKPMRNQFPYDARGIGSSYANGGRILKYSYKISTSSRANTHGIWHIYRAAGLHLRYAEAANRAGYPKLAWAFLNNGIGSTSIVPSDAFRWRLPDNSDWYPFDSCFTTGWGYKKPYPEDFRFDGRYPRAWGTNAGVRGRVNMPPLNFPAGFATTQDSVRWLEQQIIREAGLELAFEGQRWSDLVRIARRMNKEGRDGYRYLFDENIKKKYDRAHIPAPAFTADEKSWYLPFNE